MLKRVLLGMSGGIDSSVSAIMLKEQGYEVVGLTLRLWDKIDHRDDEPEYIQKAKNLAHQLDLKHYVCDVREEFNDKVIRYFLSDYQKGNTPNACAFCNPEIKWGTLLKQATQLNCEFVATGHYVQKEQIGGKWFIKKGVDAIKDQSYFLWNLKQDELQKTIFPLGGFTKKQIRDYAILKGFEGLDKQKESMGVCFLQQTDYRDFLKTSFELKGISFSKGDIIDHSGTIIGQHDGVPYYTIGQKRGLDVPEGKSFYVSKLDADHNRVEVGAKSDLLKKKLWIRDYHLIDTDTLINCTNLTTLVRGYGLNPDGHSIVDVLNPNQLFVQLSDFAWAPAPGQPVAFYDGDLLLGGGILEKAE
ncbi:MAG: tRNA 2-thiouridine(34) synthase MnmA [Bacteroidales bacterium]|nr:tRNA 2-thiouridine(34) synthase MnmA [Bacteroidales bacterium]